MTQPDKKSGLATALAYQAGIKPNDSDLDRIGGAAVEQLKRIGEFAQLRLANQSVKEMIGGEERNPAKDFREYVGAARELAGIDEGRLREERERVKEAEERRRQVEEQAQATASRNEGSTMQLLQFMLKNNEESTQRWLQMMNQREQQYEERMARLEKKLESGQSSNSQDNPLQQIAHQTLIERLTAQPPDPMQEFQRAKEMVSAFSPPPASNDSSLRLAEMQYDLGLRKLDRDDEFRRWESEQKIALDKQKMENQRNMMSALAPMVSFLTGGAARPQQNSDQQSTGTGAAPQQNAPLYRFRCTNTECGKELLHPEKDPGLPCPDCGAEVKRIGG